MAYLKGARGAVSQNPEFRLLCYVPNVYYVMYVTFTPTSELRQQRRAAVFSAKPDQAYEPLDRCGLVPEISYQFRDGSSTLHQLLSVLRPLVREPGDQSRLTTTAAATQNRKRHNYDSVQGGLKIIGEITCPPAVQKSDVSIRPDFGRIATVDSHVTKSIRKC